MPAMERLPANPQRASALQSKLRKLERCALARIILLFSLLMICPLSAKADTVVERHRACADRTKLADVLWLSASNRQVESTELFETGVQHRNCRFLEIGEIVAVLAVNGLVRLFSFASGDRLWTHRNAIARCMSAPDWLPQPEYDALIRSRPSHAAILECHPRATKWRPLNERSRGDEGDTDE